ncbi:MAG: insulinase family protein [Gammaproteobacteria bacterium]
MADIHARIQGAPRQFLVIGEGRNHVAVAQSLEGQWQPQAGPADGVFAPAFEPRRVQEAWVTNTQVNFCARAYATVPAAHPDAAVLHVLGRFLGNGFLHRTIREQGGAYGCGAAYDGDSGSFHFYSYRDPRLAETLADFDAALRWLEAGPHEPRRLEEAILGVIAALDRPSSPAGEASKAFLSQLYGRTPEYRRRLRQRVLGVGIDDLVRVARTYLTAEGAHTAVVTGSRQQETCRALGLERLSL